MRRAALIGVSAAATLALGGASAACGGEGGKPYVAVGAETESSRPVPPHGKVELVPLDGASATPGGRSTAPSSPHTRSGDGTAGARGGAAEARGGSRSGGGDGSAAGGSAGSSATPGTSGGGTPATGDTTDTPSTGGTPTPAPTPTTPAALTLGAPTRTPTPTRWCESVTIPVRNTGGTPVKPGTLTFATHIIGLLGVDWATITTEQPLAPVAAHTATSRTYTVCVDSWRVPLGTHIETRTVTADWR
ncbi:hypothetical protein [Streptomyces sp. NPDC059994]|uniref:hypothetical protein n=1 Tax=Streptomyces sp. NPDC059994 TaxID=3347029 RepID=UPI0036B8F5AB